MRQNGQAEGIFKCFFPSKPAGVATTSPPEEDVDTSQKNLPLPKRQAPSHTIPMLSQRTAKRCRASRYLLKNKVRPRECVDEVAQWHIYITWEVHHGLNYFTGSLKNARLGRSSRRRRQKREVKEKKETEEKECKEVLCLVLSR
ncbi:hypothetical protein C8R48DRAFT_771473 [Suillus tomentosus]|nr:hypothetical protein C8R48DRAFT_771473 [Suillus tomentosus]